MTKNQMLEMIKLLSALESFSLSCGKQMPDYLLDRLDAALKDLCKEVLK